MVKITKQGRLYLKPTDYKFLKVRVGDLITVKFNDTQITLTEFNINASFNNHILIQKSFYLSPSLLKLKGFNKGDEFKIIDNNFIEIIDIIYLI